VTKSHFAINMVMVGAWWGVAGASMALGNYLFGLVCTIMGLCMLAQPHLQRRAFERGRILGRMEGRFGMLSSIQEAQQREMKFSEWLQAEFERDGIPIVVLHEDDDAPE
jgi:hypothetical protein